MIVDEPWHERAAFPVDGGDPGGWIRITSDCRDLIAANKNVGGLTEMAIDHVEHADITE